MARFEKDGSWHAAASDMSAVRVGVEFFQLQAAIQFLVFRTGHIKTGINK